MLLKIQPPTKKPQPTDLAVGIDLGTTNSLLSYTLPQGSTQILVVENSILVPSVVAYDPLQPRTPVVGQAAVKLATRDNSSASPQPTSATLTSTTEISTPPVNYASPKANDRIVFHSIKRLMGKNFAELSLEEQQHFPREIITTSSNDKIVSFQVGERQLTPISISADILKYLCQQAEQQLQRPIHRAIITVPAYFDEAARIATKNAATIAGLQAIRLLNEPTAAALAYGLEKQVNGVYLVYDLGGGTFDVSILRLQQGIFQVIGTSGDRNLGGDDIDHALMSRLSLAKPLAKQLKESLSRQQLQTSQQDNSTSVTDNSQGINSKTSIHPIQNLDSQTVSLQQHTPEINPVYPLKHQEKTIPLNSKKQQTNEQIVLTQNTAQHITSPLDIDVTMANPQDTKATLSTNTVQNTNAQTTLPQQNNQETNEKLHNQEKQTTLANTTAQQATSNLATDNSQSITIPVSFNTTLSQTNIQEGDTTSQDTSPYEQQTETETAFTNAIAQQVTSNLTTDALLNNPQSSPLDITQDSDFPVTSPMPESNITYQDASSYSKHQQVREQTALTSPHCTTDIVDDIQNTKAPTPLNTGTLTTSPKSTTWDTDTESQQETAYSTATVVKTSEDNPYNHGLPPPITTAELDMITAPFIQRTLKIITDLLQEINLTPEDIKGVILVGGSTRLHQVRQQLATLFGVEKILTDVNPEEVVALGAGIYANSLTNGTAQDNLLLDVCPLSLGIETLGGLMEKVIPRNTPIPYSTTMQFTTYYNNQTKLKFKVLQGERPLVSECRPLAEFILDGLPPRPAGETIINLTFSLDVNNLLTVSAVDTQTNIQQTITVEPAYGLSLAEIKEIITQSYTAGEHDKTLQQQTNATIMLKQY